MKTDQVIWQATENALQAPNDASLAIFVAERFAIKVKGPSKDQENARNPIMEV